MQEILLATQPKKAGVYEAFVAWAGQYQLVSNTGTTDTLPYVGGTATAVRYRLMVPTAIAQFQGFGTSWGALNALGYAGPIVGAMAHAFPSTDIFNENMASGRLVLYTNRYANTGSAAFTGYTRNGYTTNSKAGPNSTFRMEEFIYYDYSLNSIMSLNPWSTNVNIPKAFVVPTT